MSAVAKHRSIQIDLDVATRMRDGATLYADVYRPADPGRYPVLLSRTPYDKSDFGTRDRALDAIRAAGTGYALVIQDVRGRYTSEGDFYPFLHEVEDGYDTVEWAGEQPWSSGKVGMFGMSYVGATQWLAALARPPHLCAIAPCMTSDDYYEGWTYQGGAFQLNFALSWSLGLVLDNLETLKRHLGDLGERAVGLTHALDHLTASATHLPLATHPLPSPDLAPYYYDWLAHPSNDAYWRRWCITDRHSEIGVPAFNIGGWYDIFLGGTLRNFTGMRAGSMGEAARTGQRLIVGPWFHSSAPSGLTGDRDFGLAAHHASVDLHGRLLRWFDHWLKDPDPALAEEPPVRLFVMGTNRWRDEWEWPLARTRYTDYYLRGGGRANGLEGDGRLSPEAPGEEPPDVYLYDPRDPVPTRGGALCCHDAQVRFGAFDQRDIERRRDVLVFSTEPLAQSLEVTGPIRVTLWAASSAPDTDFTAKLVDVGPGGCGVNLTDGIIRARYRESTAQAKPIEPGRPYQYEIDLWATSNVFLPGHRIRLEISSSNFPRFDRNPNTGAPFGTEAGLAPAMQTVFHEGRYPSKVTLPLIPAGG